MYIYTYISKLKCQTNFEDLTFLNVQIDKKVLAVFLFSM